MRLRHVSYMVWAQKLMMLVAIEKYNTTGETVALVGINRGNKDHCCQYHNKNCGTVVVEGMLVHFHHKKNQIKHPPAAFSVVAVAITAENRWNIGKLI